MSVLSEFKGLRLLPWFALVGGIAVSDVRLANAQFVSSQQASAPSPFKHPDQKTTTEVSLSLLGQFTPTRSETTVNSYSNPSQTDTYIFATRQGTSSSAGVEATFHQQFRRFRGYNINLGYTRFAEKFSTHDLGSVVPSDPGYAPTDEHKL